MTGLLNEGFAVYAESRYENIKSKKYNNPYKINSDKAAVIWGLTNEELVKRVNLEYKNMESNDKKKKNDPEIVRLSTDEKELKDAVEKHPNMVKLKETQEEEKRVLEDTDTEINQHLVELAMVKSELSNERSEYQADTREFKGLFKLCMDEIDHRLDNGAMES